MSYEFYEGEDVMDYDEMTSESQHDLEDQAAEAAYDDAHYGGLQLDESPDPGEAVRVQHGRVYTVRSGEGLQRIAHRTSLRAKDIATLNPDVDFGNLKPGTVLRLP